MFIDPDVSEYIHLKSLLGDHYTVRKLLQMDPANAHATNGRLTVPPLFYACRYGHLKVAKVLVEFNADVHFKTQGWTCLHEACVRGHAHIVEYLLSLKLDPDAAIVYSGMTGLMHAARRNFEGILEILLQHGADVWRRNVEGKTALDFATDPACRQRLERTMKHDLLWKALACTYRENPTITVENPVVECLVQDVPDDIFRECLEYL